VSVAGRGVARKVGQAWGARRDSPATDLRRRVAAAARACAGADARAADAAIARALQAATVARARVSVLDALAGEIVGRLEGAGVSRDAATQFAEVLRECEEARFSPEASDVGTVRERWAKAQAAIRALARA
jgi:hypothetical protein